MQLADHAAEYAARGWSVFPLIPGEKYPAIPGGYRTATTNPDKVAEWWTAQPDCNIGIATGTLVVIDIDDPTALAQLIRAGHHLPPTLSSVTGRGGAHYWYRQTDQGLRITSGRLPGVGLTPGIDLRAIGGHAVAPPSVHPNGNRYQWLHEPDDDDVWPWDHECGPWPTEPAPVPTWLKRQPVERRVTNMFAGVSVLPDSYYRRALADELEKVRHAPEGVRNHTLNSAAFSLGQLCPKGLDPNDVARLLYDAGRRAGLEDRETIAAIRSGITAGMEQPRDR